MSLSMDEQRMLAEIERRLSAEDPRLAARLSSFRRPGPTGTLRSPRAKIIGSLFTVALVAVVSMIVYAMVPFRAHGAKTTSSPQASTSASVSHFAAPSGATANNSAVSTNGTRSTSGTSGKTGASIRTGASAKVSATRAATPKNNAGTRATGAHSAKTPAPKTSNPAPATAG